MKIFNNFGTCKILSDFLLSHFFMSDLVYLWCIYQKEGKLSNLYVYTKYCNISIIWIDQKLVRFLRVPYFCVWFGIILFKIYLILLQTLWHGLYKTLKFFNIFRDEKTLSENTLSHIFLSDFIIAIHFPRFFFNLQMIWPYTKNWNTSIKIFFECAVVSHCPGFNE